MEFETITIDFHIAMHTNGCICYVLILLCSVFYYTGEQIEGDEICWACSTHIYNILVPKPEGKRPLGRRRRRWEDIMGLRETGFGGVDWMHLAQDRDQ
jgi:hypothetical protein